MYQKETFLVEFFGEGKMLYYVGLIKFFDNTEGQCEGRFLRKGKTNEKSQQTTLTFKGGDKFSFPESDIFIVLPNPIVTEETKSYFVMLMHCNFVMFVVFC